MSRFTKFNTYMHKVIAVIDGIETTIPFNFRTLYDVFPETMAKRMEEKLLKNFEYNKKVPILEFQKQDDEDLSFWLIMFMKRCSCIIQLNNGV